MTRDRPLDVTTVELQKGRIAALDGLRGIAILLVCFHHYTQQIPLQGPVDNGFYAIVNSTWVGVDLFFVLSGFLITGILCDARGSQYFFRVFWLRRCLRIFPPYYLLLAILFLILPLLGPPPALRVAAEPAWFWLYGANLLTAWHGWPDRPVAHLWSLAIEEQFYLVWPFLIYLLSRQRLLYVLPIIITGVSVLRYWQLSHGVGAFEIYTLTWNRLDTLALGAWLAVIAREPRLWARLRRHEGSLALFLALTLFFFGWSARGLEYPHWSTLGHTLNYLAIAGLSMILVSRAAAKSGSGSFLDRQLSRPGLVKLGAYSYGMYLFHLPVDCISRWLGLHPMLQPPIWGSTIPYAMLYILGNSIVAFLCACISWHLFEKHCLRIKDLFRYRKDN